MPETGIQGGIITENILVVKGLLLGQIHGIICILIADLTKLLQRLSVQHIVAQALASLSGIHAVDVHDVAAVLGQLCRVVLQEHKGQTVLVYIQLAFLGNLRQELGEASLLDVVVIKDHAHDLGLLLAFALVLLLICLLFGPLIHNAEELTKNNTGAVLIKHELRNTIEQFVGMGQILVVFNDLLFTLSGKQKFLFLLSQLTGILSFRQSGDFFLQFPDALVIFSVEEEYKLQILRRMVVRQFKDHMAHKLQCGILLIGYNTQDTGVPQIQHQRRLRFIIGSQIVESLIAALVSKIVWQIGQRLLRKVALTAIAVRHLLSEFLFPAGHDHFDRLNIIIVFHEVIDLVVDRILLFGLDLEQGFDHIRRTQRDPHEIVVILRTGENRAVDAFSVVKQLIHIRIG